MPAMQMSEADIDAVTDLPAELAITMYDADSIPKPMFVPEAGAATRPLLERLHDWIITVDHKKTRADVRRLRLVCSW